MIKETGNDSLHSNLTWTKESHLAFDTIKHKLQEAPALALPDYSKKFALYVASSTNGKHACAVLTQPTGIGTSPQPIAYYSVAYSEVEMGFAPCYRAMAGVSLMYEKSSALTMGYPVTILCHHSLRNLLNHGKYTLTMPRIRDYYRLFEQEDVTLARCHTVNPAETLPTPDDGEPHNCVEEAEKYSKLRLDLQALPLPEADLEYWTDGSCYRVGETLSAGYAVVRAQGPEFVVEKAEAIPQPCSAQLAELVALTEACNLASGQRVTIYTDSAYAHNVCHLFGAIWKGRGFKKADGSPVQHHAQIVKLLQAMMKPKEIAIAKCAAHKSDSSRVTQGNKTADEAAKYATGADRPGKVLLVTHEVELTEKITLQDLLMMQEEANALDKNLWLASGASQDKTGMWRNHEGLIVAPSAAAAPGPLLVLAEALVVLVQRLDLLGALLCGDLLKQFITMELMRWASLVEDYGTELREGSPDSPTTDVFASSEEGEKRWKDLKNRVAEHNIRIMAKYYTRISMKRMANLLDLSIDESEEFLSFLVVNKTIYAKVDRLAGIINFQRPKDPNDLLNDWSHKLNSLMSLVNKTTHLIAKEEMIHNLQ
ncbi:hypothetical protein NHX12_034172 [Muraenolepis orangiensis]|uniref:26S proteasome non-ATPase regulatory subunit 12 n=1 Tax=Muraenolepis orangiensis TaxID=630683 RepID=A0A9Q0D8Z1_9TELE|nr:hypothetical protein NHX12_034172 [Muraenolepis orangiensis]